MEVLSQSPFLQALGYAIANSLWQVGLLWLVVVLITGVFKFSSEVKYKIGATAQFAGFVWFVVTLQFYYQKCVGAIASAQIFAEDTNSYTAPAIQADKGFDMLSVVVKVEQLLPYLSVAYLALLLFLTIRWFRNYRHTQMIKSQGLQKIDVEWRLFVKRMTDALSLKNEVKIYLSDLIKSPLTIGFLKPIILIPVASINYLTTEQLEAVILHELAHIKRFDYLVNLVQSVIEIALFFNPFTQLLSGLIKKERENCCDDWVLQFQYNPSMYAEALLQIAYLQTQPALAMNATGNKGGDLLQRVKRLLNCNEKRFNYRNHVIALLLMTGIVSSIAWLQPAVRPANVGKAGELQQPPLVVEPMAAQVDNPLFNPVFFLSKPLKEEVSKAVKEAKESVKHIEPVVAENVQKQLSTIAPLAIDKLNNIFDDKFQAELAKATDQAKDEIAKINWSEVNNATNKIFIDTLQIKNAIAQAFSQKQNMKVKFDEVKNQLLQTKMEMGKFSAINFKKITDDALDMAFDELQNLNVDFNPATDHDHVIQLMPKEKIKDAKERQRIQLHEQQRLLELQAKSDSMRAISFRRERRTPPPAVNYVAPDFVGNDEAFAANVPSPPDASMATYFRVAAPVGFNSADEDDNDNDKDFVIVLNDKTVHVKKEVINTNNNATGGGSNSHGAVKITIEIE